MHPDHFHYTLFFLLWGITIMGCGHTIGGVDIWQAVERNDAQAIRTFHESGGDVNIQRLDGSTPLWVALEEKKRESFETLLELGASPNIVMSGKRVVTHWAALEEDSWWLEKVLKNGADPNLMNTGYGRPSESSPLSFAITDHNLANVKLLVQKGANINLPNKYDTFPLAEAAFQNDFSIVLYLLENGADPQIAQMSGLTFLDWLKQRKLEWYALEEDRQGLIQVREWLEARGYDLGELQ